MDMGMGLQLLTPSMQHAEEADLRPEMLGIASDFQQGFSTGTEEQAVEELLILQGQRGASRCGRVKTRWA